MNLLERLSLANRVKLSVYYGDKFPTIYKNIIVSLENEEFFTNINFGLANDICIATGTELNNFCLLFEEI